MRILYLEDNPMDADLVRRELARRGTDHAVDVARTLEEARSCLATPGRYDLLLADLHLPDGSGLDLLSEVRAQRLPLACVVLTSHGDEITAVAALKAGANDYQAKRHDFTKELVLTLESALARFRRETAQREGRLRVLYAEHHPADVDLTMRHLSQHAPHIRCEVVHSADDVLARLPLDGETPCPFDVVLLDYRLPGENALDLLKTIRMERGLSVPIVVVTGQGDDDVAAQTLRLGATDYLVKHAHYLFQLPVTLESAHYQAALVRERDMLRQSEAHLRDSENLLNIAGRVANLGGWSLDRVTRTVRWSDEMCRLHDMPPGYSPNIDEALAFFVPESRDYVRECFLSCLDDGTPFDEEVEIITATGLRRWVRGIGAAARDAAGDIVRVQGALQDISERRQAADALRQMAESTAGILESITDAFFSVDRDWRITYVNRETERVVQQPREALVGRSAWEAFPQALGGPLESGARAAMAQRRPHFFEAVQTPLGRWLEARADPSGNGLAIYFRDITDRHASEVQLREQASLLDKAQDAIVVRDLEHRVTYWNRSAERLYGWSSEEIRGQSMREVVYSDHESFDTAMTTLLATGEWTGELPQVDRHGRPLLIESRWTLVRNDSGEPQTVLAFNTDISERKRLEAQFLRAQRMEGLGTLAGGIAHDLNNVLAPILLSIELLRLDETDADRLELLATVEASARRGADMVTQVLSFARGVEGRRIDVAIGPLIRDLKKFADETFLKSIDVRANVPADLWRVCGDPTQLHQLLLNLCVNARESMIDGGTLTLSARNVLLDETYTAQEPEARLGPHVLLEVSDTGTGIAPGVIERIFEPFFTTKDIGKGTGLGLSTSLAIVKSHGGLMRVVSDVGKGTTFRVYLPAVAGATAGDAAPDVRALPRGTGELILVIDDERSVRDVTQQTLEAFGYRVVSAGDGAEAVMLFAERRHEVAAVLIDMMMPVMDGPATIQALRKLQPTVPIIAASGLGDRTVGHVAKDIALFLSKPYAADVLLEGLSQVLRSETARPATDAPPV